MKSLVISAWAWVVAHPAEVAGFIVSLLSAIAAATVANARAKGAPVGWFARFVDRLAVKTRQGAKNEGWSWPAFGRSVFEAAIDASTPERETQAPPPPSEPGYAEQWVLGVIALAAALALALSGCPMPAPDGCAPGARRCHEDTPQVCSPGQRWTPADVTCSTVNASCIVRDGVPACLRGEQ